MPSRDFFNSLSHKRTFAYLTERLAGCDVTVTRLAQGVPVGGKLDYLN